MIITPKLFEAFLKCPTKCWLRSRGEAATTNDYADWYSSQNESYRVEGGKRMIAGVPPDECVTSPPETENLKTAKWRVALDFVAHTQNLESKIHAVERMPSQGRGKAANFIPIRFLFTNKLTREDKLLVAFDDLILSEHLGKGDGFGKIIHGDNYSTLKVKTAALTGEVRNRAERIVALLSNTTPPDLVLNRHCGECEFKTRCREKAIEKDDLSLLSGMGERERKKLNSKGIFTVTQLSYIFRPRRRPKRLRDKKEKYHHSLKALAIREKKIHIVGTPEVKIEGTPVYLDVEGLPDRDFYYLIGVQIGNGETAVQHSLWADSIEDEGKIWREFLAIVETVDKPVLIHYGSYETTFLKVMKERHGGLVDASVATRPIDSVINLVSVMFAQIYFPTYTNGLKEVVGWLGFKWSEAEPSGKLAVVWRYSWEEKQESALKADLVRYNAEDCKALALLNNALSGLTWCGVVQADTGKEAEVVYTDNLKNPLVNKWRKFSSPLSELEFVNKAAHWNYQRSGDLVHADETQVSIKGTRAYVWVLTNMHEVVYLYSDTREGELLQTALSGFKGVLVSDFYAVYDSFDCPQQKCLIHLVRDLNGLMLENPYDEELKRLVKNFGQLLMTIVGDVDRHGLKRYFLRKHVIAVDRFYRNVVEAEYQSPTALTCKERFKKSRHKLFTFLDFDGVPWNNNNAEHAIKAFAALRDVIEGSSTEKGIQEYLILLSVCQTCKYMGVDFLDFLRSGEKDIHAFAEAKGRRKRRSTSISENAMTGLMGGG
jgi:predicted RecB family nuclease